MSSEIESWLAEFARGAAFVEKYPYYAAILGRLLPVADPSVQRMAVSLHHARFYLHVNVESFLREPQFVTGVLLHEVHHVALGHLTHPKFAECEEPELMDLAVEMSANEFIEEALPPHISWRAYTAYGIRARQSTRERYDKLLAHLQGTGSRPRAANDERDAQQVIDDHRFLRKGEAIAGGVAQTALTVKRALDDAREHRRDQPPPEKQKPKERPFGKKMGDAEQTQTDDAGLPRYLICGRTAEQLLEELFETTRAPEHAMDWRAALAMFFARARSPVHSWSRPSRRFPERIFEVPGRSWTPRRVDEPRLLVAIDTSLSMTRRELEEVARQLAVLSERAHVIIAECDVQVSRVYPFPGRLDTVMGRGGTDLRPVFAPSLLGTHDVDGVVYFTDGDGPFPREAPPVPTLWVLTKPREFGCPWGERARMRT